MSSLLGSPLLPDNQCLYKRTLIRNLSLGSLKGVVIIAKIISIEYYKKFYNYSSENYPTICHLEDSSGRINAVCFDPKIKLMFRGLIKSLGINKLIIWSNMWKTYISKRNGVLVIDLGNRFQLKKVMKDIDDRGILWDQAIRQYFAKMFTRRLKKFQKKFGLTQQQIIDLEKLKIHKKFFNLKDIDLMILYYKVDPKLA